MLWLLLFPEQVPGGGGFVLIYDKATNDVSSIDYRSAAPKSATSDLFVQEDSVVRFGHSVNAVPGSVAGLLKAHQDHGSMLLSDLLMPSITLARDGFEVTHDLNYVLEWEKNLCYQMRLPMKIL